MNEPKPLPSETKKLADDPAEVILLLNDPDSVGRTLPLCIAAECIEKLETSLASLADELRLAREALSHILWIKDGGVDSIDETGTFRNWPETERDAMYEIATKALANARQGK